MPQLPQIRRDVLQRIFTNPAALRAYEALQEALANTPDDVVTLGVHRKSHRVHPVTGNLTHKPVEDKVVVYCIS